MDFYENVHPGAISIPRTNIVKATDKPNTATLFLFHGSGGCGEDFKQWIDILNRQELKFPHIKIIYPTAPMQPYTLNAGLPSNVWFEQSVISIKGPEIRHSIDIMCNKVSQLIHREVAAGIPLNRIAIGGFSMGGCLSLHVAYRFKRSLAGCLAMSSFLNDDSLVYESLMAEPADDLPELLMFHGTADNTVPLEWAKKSFSRLTKAGVKGTFVPLNQAEHMLVQSELKEFKDWLLLKLPDK